MSDADIDKMVKDAEAHASEDKQRRELVDAKIMLKPQFTLPRNLLLNMAIRFPAPIRAP